MGWWNIDDVQVQGSPKLFMAIQERNGVWCKGTHRNFFNCFEMQSTARLAVTFHADNNYEPLEKKAITIIALWIVCDARTWHRRSERTLFSQQSLSFNAEHVKRPCLDIMSNTNPRLGTKGCAYLLERTEFGSNEHLGRAKSFRTSSASRSNNHVLWKSSCFKCLSERRKFSWSIEERP